MKQDRHEWEFIKDDKMKVVRHFKRELADPSSFDCLYIYLGVATHSETKEKFVLYESLTTQEQWVRPYDMWMSEVDHQKYPNIKQVYRFEKITTEERLSLRHLAQTKLDSTKMSEDALMNILTLL